jgi:hypothetical protein
MIYGRTPFFSVEHNHRKVHMDERDFHDYFAGYCK